MNGGRNALCGHCFAAWFLAAALLAPTLASGQGYRIASGSDGFYYFYQAAINNSGAVVFSAYKLNGDGSTRTGIYKGASGGLVTMIEGAVGDLDPTDRPLAINSAGTVALTGFTLSTGNRQVYVGSGPVTSGNLSQHDPFGQTFGRFVPVILDLNDHGTVTYGPFISQNGVISSVQSVQELNNGNQRLLMTGMTGGSAVYLVTFANAVPVATNLVGTIPNGLTVFSLDGSVQFNDRGTVVVYGGKAGNISGLYRIGGDPVVEFGGQNEYSAFSSFAFALNNNDEVAFLASSHTLQKVGYFRGPNPITDKIVLAGDIVAGSQISQFSSFGPKRGWFNDRGQIVFIGTDFNSEEGIWVTSSGISPPDPNSTIIRWNPPVSPPAGSFAVTDNWQPLNNDPPRVPQKTLTLNDTALFDRAEAYTVDLEGNHEHVERLVVKNGNVVFVNGSIKADATSVDIPSVEVDNARLDIATAMTLTNNHGLIGSSAASRVDVGAGGHWVSLGSLRIGSGGEGILNIDAGGTVESAESRIGTGAGGGKAVVGDGGHWITGNLALGAGGHGELTITNGGTVGSEIAVIGLEPGLGNSVVVRGVSALMTPSSWNMDILEVGRAGTGQLEIRDAGHIEAGILFVAERAGVTGSVTVSGLGVIGIPSVLAADFLAVGRRGVGDLTIEGGAQVNVASQMSLADLETQGDATVTVTGVDPVSAEPSTLSLSSDAVLTVGGKGTASLVIKAGGEVDNSSSITLVQSETATKPAEVRVEGSDSLLKTDILIIKGGAARVTLVDGKVTCGSVDIGQSGTLAGFGTVDGTIYNNGGTVSPGLSPGTLTVHGSYEQAADGRLLMEIGGTNTADCDRLIVTNSATLNGNVTFRFINGFAPKAGQHFDFLSVGETRSNTFATVALQNLAPGFQFNLETNGPVTRMTALNDGVFSSALPGQVTLTVTNIGGITYASYIITTSNTCQSISLDGQLTRTNNQFSQGFQGTTMVAGGDCASEIATVTGMLILGALPPGTYSLILTSAGQSFDTVPFRVVSDPGKTLLSPTLLADGSLQFQIDGLSSVSYSVEASEDLRHWTTIYSGTLPDTFNDPDAAIFPTRYYRARIGP